MKDFLTLTVIASIVRCLVAKIVILPDNRTFEIPDPHTYSYILEDESPASLDRLYILSTIEPHAALLCPKGYSIQEMRQELVVNEIYSHLIPRSILKEQLVSLRNLKQNDDYKRSPCPTAYHCLGYQACLFTYSNDLCQREPLPPVSEYFVLIVGCFRDDLFEVPKKFRKNKDFILHIQYSPKGKIPDGGFSSSNLTHVESDESVFNTKCPSLEVAKQEGYFGNCSKHPPSPEVISLQLWSALGRIQLRNCKTKLVQTLCALHFSNEGLCIPPIYRNENPDDNKIYNSQIFPDHKYSFKLDKYNKFLFKKFPDLIPARLAFVVMTERDIKRTISLLHNVYRENFLYVIHIDKEEALLREELETEIEGTFPTRHNIVLLSLDQSFSTTLDSYETVRAKMEAYENLLHLGIWDFVITLSEDDVPLRNIDDLSFALAPHRGLSFLPDLHIIKNTKITPGTSCGGLVHEFFSLSYIFRPINNLSLCKSSDDGILSRDFVEYLIDENKHSKEVNEQQFFLQTIQFSHNTYIPTVLMNSPFKNSVHISPIRIMKRQLQNNILNEVIYAEVNFTALKEAKLKGKEYFVEKDERLINRLSHNFFFGQKLSNSLEDDVQKLAIQLAKGEYYQHLEKMLPVPVIRSLLEETLKNISVELKLNPEDLSIENLINLIIVPSLIPHQTFCRSKLISPYLEFNIDYNYWLDVSTYFKSDRRQHTLRIMLRPTLTSKICYERDNLRLVSLSSWYFDENQDSLRNWTNFQEILPVPYFSSNVKGAVISLLVADEAQFFIKRENIVSLKGKSGPIKLNIALESPSKTERCFKSTEVVLLEENSEFAIRNDDNNKDLLVKQHIISLACNIMEPGFWTVKINQTHPRISREYTLQFYVLDIENQNNMDALSEDISSLWTLRHFASVTKNDSYDFYSDELEQRTSFHLRESKNHQKNSMIHHTVSKKKDTTKNENILELGESTGFEKRSDKIYIFICGGGLISSFAVFLTVIVLFCGWKYRFHPKIVLCFVLMLCLITVFQIITIVSVCK